MHLIWFTLGLGPGDEVIVPAQTHTATAHAVELTGARAVFVDVERDTGNIDIAAFEAAITPRTKGVAPVHFLGMPVDMTRLVEIARRHKLFVLEDCALAFGTRIDGTHAGLFGDAGVFSFYPVKHITTAEGGMIITRDAQLAASLKLRKAFGVDRTHAERKVPGTYDVVALGFNYRMSEIHCALGIEQVKKLPGFLEQRARNYSALSKALADIPGVSQLTVHRRPLPQQLLLPVGDPRRAAGAAARGHRGPAQCRRRRHQRLLSAAGAAHDLLSRALRLARRQLSQRGAHQRLLDRVAGRAASDCRKTCNTSARRWPMS